MLGLFRDGNDLIPTEFEIQKLNNNKNGLYLNVTLTKIGADVMESGFEALSGISSNKFRLADVFKNVNLKDKHILKYIPDGFLSEKQKEAKIDAIDSDKTRISSLSFTMV